MTCSPAAGAAPPGWVASTRRSAPAASKSRTTSDTEDRRCSQLSTTSNARHRTDQVQQLLAGSVTEAPDRPRVASIDASSPSGTVQPGQLEHPHPVGKLVHQVGAHWLANRVLPTPPGPTNVTSRAPQLRRHPLQFRAAADERSGLGGTGPEAVEGAQRARSSAPDPSPTSCQTCSERLRSRKRWKPRSTNEQPRQQLVRVAAHGPSIREEHLARRGRSPSTGPSGSAPGRTSQQSRCSASPAWIAIRTRRRPDRPPILSCPSPAAPPAAARPPRASEGKTAAHAVTHVLEHLPASCFDCLVTAVRRDGLTPPPSRLGDPPTAGSTPRYR